MSSHEYNHITYRDLLLKIDGFQQRENNTERIFRRVGFSAYIAPNVDRKTMHKRETKYWPIKGDKMESETYKFEEKKESFKELLELITNGKA